MSEGAVSAGCNDDAQHQPPEPPTTVKLCNSVRCFRLNTVVVRNICQICGEKWVGECTVCKSDVAGLFWCEECGTATPREESRRVVEEQERAREEKAREKAQAAREEREAQAREAQAVKEEREAQAQAAKEEREAKAREAQAAKEAKVAKEACQVDTLKAYHDYQLTNLRASHTVCYMMCDSWLCGFLIPTHHSCSFSQGPSCSRIPFQDSSDR